MIVVISTDVMPYEVVISCDKPGIINSTPNMPITVVVDVKKDGIDGHVITDIDGGMIF